MINSGDTAWVLIATALVFFMMPGLALFYGGLVGQKNVVATMAQSFVAIGIVSLLWVVVGYSLAFGSDHAGVIGGFGNVMLRGVGAAPTSFAPHIPALLFIAFWSLIVYCPFAHWVWGGGFLGSGGLHALDFAGGSVVHELAEASAMAAVLYLGRRQRIDKPHSVPFVLLGGGFFGSVGSDSTRAVLAARVR